MLGLLKFFTGTGLHETTGNNQADSKH